MNKRPSVSLLNDYEPKYGERATFVRSDRNEMVEAAEQVIRAAREAGSVDAERVLQAVQDLLKTASGGDNTQTA